MVGDTLHTDILGGQAAGHGTILVTDHGLFKGRDVAPSSRHPASGPTGSSPRSEARPAARDHKDIKE
ncbi:HAD hydrolase-like protein [Gemmobacter lanyuensis]